MMMRVLSVGLLAGLLAGVVVATLQNFTTTPLILQAEVFENAAPEKKASLHDDMIVHTVASDMPHFILRHDQRALHRHPAPARELLPRVGRPPFSDQPRGAEAHSLAA